MNNDLISRSELKKALKSNCKPEFCPDYNTAWCERCCKTNDFEDLIDNAPTVEPNECILIVGKRSGKREMLLNALRPQGEWIETNSYDENIICPFCKTEFNGDIKLICGGEDPKFCPNCGAAMHKPNCVTCDHFGDCEGCEKGEEE